MANNWPDGGEHISEREKLVMGAIGVVLIAGLTGAVLVGALHLVGGRLSRVLLVVVGAISLGVGLLWVRPWEAGPPRPGGRE
jgi:hypothetical protein